MYITTTERLLVNKEAKVTRNMGLPRGRRQLTFPQRVWRG